MWQFGKMASGGAIARTAYDHGTFGNTSPLVPEVENRTKPHGPLLGQVRVQPEDYFNNIIFFTVTKLPASSL